jgi:hypothetical protein
MSRLINHRNVLRTGLLASGGLAVLSQLGKVASPLTTSKEKNNKAIVGRWFTDFWGKTCNFSIVDELGCFCPRSELSKRSIRQTLGRDRKSLQIRPLNKTMKLNLKARTG